MSAGPAPTHYEVLGVEPAATADQLRAAYRALVARYHPDLHSGNPLQALAAERLVQINAAYEVLADQRRRADYDARLGNTGAGRAGPATAAGRDAAGRGSRPAYPWYASAAVLLLVALLLWPVSRLLLRAVLSRGPLFALLVGLALLGAGAWWLRRRRRP